MTQEEVESVTREIRNKCLHGSWDELVKFWDTVLDNLEGAYRASVQRTLSPGQTYSPQLNDAQTELSSKLAVALSHLAGHRRVEKWDAELSVK
jgi:hypothetical protein